MSAIMLVLWLLVATVALAILIVIAACIFGAAYLLHAIEAKAEEERARLEPTH